MHMRIQKHELIKVGSYDDIRLLLDCLKKALGRQPFVAIFLTETLERCVPTETSTVVYKLSSKTTI